MSLPALHELDGIVVDIEGTTTPISFVYEVLFPFARQHLGAWLEANIATAKGTSILEEFRALAVADKEDGRTIPDLSEGPGLAERVAGYALQQMDSDRKTTALKMLQGEVWISGYESGELQGVVWPDVVEAFKRWEAADVSIWVYSSGSIAAQKLLFGNSDHGNLLTWVDGHFDTTTGPKKEAASYRAIADEIGSPPGRLLFATDNLDEAVAADEAGWAVVVLRRPGNPDIDAHEFVEAAKFDELP